VATKLEFVVSKTNANENSVVSQRLTCDEVWSRYQQKSYVYLSHFKKNNANNTAIYKLEQGYVNRALRIAAEYAKIYLEQSGAGADVKKIGRFYWMGLGAFASKTVAQILDTWQSKAAGSLDRALMYQYGSSSDNAQAIHVFAKGNLWLFMDVAPWHYAWSESPNTFDHCSEKRNSANYTLYVKTALESLPWAQSTIPKVNNFRVTKYVTDAFSDLKEIENAPAGLYTQNSRLAKNQFSHLMHMADQEQRKILQEICWNDPKMKAGTETSRNKLLAWVTPMQFISFDTHYISSLHKDTKNAMKTHNLKEDPFSIAPENLIAENINSRMSWITKVAQKYHRLMQSKNGRKYMHTQLQIIASNKGWARIGTVDRPNLAPNSNDIQGY
jgi:hypothetical protein